MALGILRTPRTFAEVARVGPVLAHQAQSISATIADLAFTAVIAVSHRLGDAGLGDPVAQRRAALETDSGSTR